MGSEAVLGWRERQQALAGEAVELGTITWRLLKVLGTYCWCLGQCTTACPSSVGFCECNLGAGHTILYKATHAHLLHSAEAEAGDVAHKPPNLQHQPSALSRHCLLTQKLGPCSHFCSFLPVSSHCLSLGYFRQGHRVGRRHGRWGGDPS